MKTRKPIRRKAKQTPKPTFIFEEPLSTEQALVQDYGVSNRPYFGHDFSRIQIHANSPEMIQAKLTINQPGDSYEREAEHVVEQVTNMDVSAAETSAGAYDERREKPFLMRKAAASQETKETGDMPPIVHEVLNGSGQPLDATVQSFMEPRFGHDFSHVRIHTDERAVESAEAIRALAYTVGRDVVFGADQYAPETKTGQRLLAHELAHVIQQASGQVASTPAPEDMSVSDPSGSFEQAAEQASEAVMSASVAPPMQTSSASIIQRWTNPLITLKTDQELIRDACADRDVTAIKEISNYSLATTDQKLKMIEVLVHQTWVGPRDKTALAKLWRSFEGDFVPVASKNIDLWKESLKYDPVKELDEVERLRRQFSSDIQAIVTDYLLQNRAVIIKEMERLGIPGDQSAVAPAQTIEQADEMKRMQQVAATASKLQKAQEEAREIYVGYDVHYETGVTGAGGQSVTPTRFDPYSKRPAYDSVPEHLFFLTGVLRAPITPYQEVKTKYDKATESLTGLLTLYPALYAVSREGESATTAAFAQLASPVQAREQLGSAMRKLIQDIEQTQSKLNDGSLDPLDLTPIHKQFLVDGMKAQSTTPWRDTFPNSVARDLVEGHELDQALKALALQTAAGAAFMLAPFTGGASLYVMLAGLAVTGIKAYMSAEHYETLAQAAKTSVTPGTELVAPEQVEEAKMIKDADEIALSLSILAVGAAAAAEAIGAIKGPTPAEGETPPVEGETPGGCFVAGTQVITPRGERSIEELIAEDTVFSLDPSSDKIVSQQIRLTFIHLVPVVLDIQIGTTTITCSPEHPFWVPGKGWQNAGALQPGTCLLTKDGCMVHVVSIQQRQGSFTVFNIDVKGLHTYLVSPLGILVHNKPMSNPFKVRLEQEVIEEVKTWGKDMEDVAESWELIELEGPHKMAEVDPQLQNCPNAERYQATFRDFQGEIEKISVNYDPNTGRFGTIKRASGK